MQRSSPAADEGDGEVSVQRRMRKTSVAFLIMMGLPFAVIGATSADDNCCGPINDAGRKLVVRLDSTGVDHLWIAGHHVDWRTGEPDSGTEDRGRGNATHCSAFAAAVANSLGIYLLRPPEHGQVLLASAQVAWLQSDAARKRGWRKVMDMEEAQALANQGHLVLAAYPNLKKPGHIAIVRPADKSKAELQSDGPQITQAGERNALSTTVRIGFKYHPGAWPNGVEYYAYFTAPP
jgi:hypothetical protein